MRTGNSFRGSSRWVARRVKVRRPNSFAAKAFLFAAGLVSLATVSLAAGVAPASTDAVVVDEKTEAVIKGALKYLASKQEPTGAWGMAPEEK